MSYRELRDLDRGRAFNPAPRIDALPHVFVPFDELTGERTCEHAVLRAVTHRRRTALVGASGTGKSSVIGHVLRTAGDTVFGIRVPVSLEDPQVATEPDAFLAHLMRHLRDEAMRARPERRRRIQGTGPAAGRETTKSFGVEGGFAGAKAGFTYEITQALDGDALTNVRAAEAVRELLAIVGDHGVVPVVVLDDTDKWVSSALSPENDRIRGQFFTRILRLLAEEIDATVLLALHPAYEIDEAYRRARGFLEKEIDLPVLPDRAALERLVARRVATGLSTTEDALRLGTVITPPALDLVFAFYSATTTNIRQGVLAPLNGALTLALDAEAESIDVAHCKAEINEIVGAEWSPPVASAD